MGTVLSAWAAAQRAAEVAAEKQASDVLVLDLRPLHTFTDFFVLLTATSPPHVEVLAEEIEKALGQGGRSLLHREGEARSGWVVLDYGDLVVHLFLDAQRAFYRLEERWRGAVPRLILR
ncbi:MAG: ribosome silencing factor [Dehalococcoidia bacterium]|nr:ribosome silencing factor [Dehalococcoidia bacterium]MDW8119754.1 ribosome silencing factor [Chloroflexota bacterium]